MSKSFNGVIRGLAIAGFFALGATTAFAQDESSFDLQLNAAADTTAGSCRLTYVATNQSDQAFDRTAYEVGIFNAEGAVTRLLVLEFGSLVAGKTKILQFDLAESSCASISRIVVNDVAACTLSDGTESEFCLSNLVASSRTAIQFGI
ncbi:hypothetical protein [Marivivens marinus]|uniref:hypothetical protein n=1 Tax=Marivivens marinus TaxID=3110173 RepID=UPI003B84B6CF